MTTTRFADHLLTGIHSARPAASAVPAGTLYACSTHGLVYQSDGSSTWATWATLGAATTVATDTIWDTKGDLAAATGADAASKLAVGSNGQVLTADSTQATGIKWAAAAGGGIGATLSDTTLGSSNTFDITSISGSYGRLIALLFARTDEATTLSLANLTLNNDTGANYYYCDTNYDTTNGAGNATQNGATKLQFVAPGSTSPANAFAYLRLDILNYATGSYLKQGLYEWGGRYDTSRTRSAVGHLHYNSTTAISRITIAPNTGGKLFVTGSRLIILGF